MSEGPYKLRPLGELISSHIGGGTPSRQVASFWNGDIPWASVKDFEENSEVIRETEEHITSKGLNNSASNLIPGGTPLVCTRMAVGRAAVSNVPVAINQDVKALFPAQGVNPKYLLKLLQFIQPKMEAKSVGSTVKGIGVQDLLNTLVPTAPKELQPTIANILDSVDFSISQTQAIITKLKAVKQGLLHDLLTRGIDANGELRPPHSEAPHLYKPSPLGAIPREWEVKQLAELLSDEDPAMRSGPFGSALLKEELVEKGVPLLGIDNVFVEQFVSDYKRFVTRKKFQELSRYAVRPLDLMITIMGTVGRCCLVPDGIGDALSSKHTWTVSLDRSKYSPYLAMLQINYAPWVLQHFQQDQQGGTMLAIRSDTLRETRFPVPPPAEQEMIEVRLQEVTNRIALEQSSMEKMVKKKNGLMNDLLTGSLKVTPLLEKSPLKRAI